MIFDNPSGFQRTHLDHLLQPDIRALKSFDRMQALDQQLQLLPLPGVVDSDQAVPSQPVLNEVEGAARLRSSRSITTAAAGALCTHAERWKREKDRKDTALQ